jgi:hypothetical protein
VRRVFAVALLLAPPPPLAAQGYRLRLDNRFEAVGFRGLRLDSIPIADTVAGPGGGPATPDGFAVRCPSGAAYCLFFRPGAVQHGAPVVTTADLSMWGFGVPGLSVRATARAAVDFSGADAWPGTDPAVQLLTGYAEYSRERITIRLGRELDYRRLGAIGFDGGSLTLRDGHGLEASVYGGWGLARGAALPVTSPAVNPISDFQSSRRQLLVGAEAGWSGRLGDVRGEYLREVDPRTDYFVSERVALAGVLRPPSFAGWSVTGGADYDLAAGWWGSAEATLGYATRDVTGSLGVRRYRPHFDLWTIWGAFSPVPYRAVQAQMTVKASRQFQVHASGERYRFDDADVATPLVQVEQSGWRGELDATAWPAPEWTLEAGYTREFGPGAASVGSSASVTYAPPGRYSLTLHGARLDRPLELRFSESVLDLYGVEGRLEARPGVRLELGALRYVEDRQRPDPAAIDWNQWRVTVRAVFAFGNSGDGLGHLPPAVRR